MEPEKKGNPFWVRLLCLGHYREYPGQFEHNRSFKMLRGRILKAKRHTHTLKAYVE